MSTFIVYKTGTNGEDQTLNRLSQRNQNRWTLAQRDIPRTILPRTKKRGVSVSVSLTCSSLVPASNSIIRSRSSAINASESAIRTNPYAHLPTNGANGANGLRGYGLSDHHHQFVIPVMHETLSSIHNTSYGSMLGNPEASEVCA